MAEMPEVKIDVRLIDVFQESHNVQLIAPSAEGKEWDVVIIQPGRSLNDNYYPADVLRRAAHLFEGCKAFAYRFGEPLGDRFNHLPDRAAIQRPGGFVENQVGWFVNARYGEFTTPDGKKGEGILAKFHVLEGHEWLRKNLKDAWNHRRMDILGFSIDARGKAREQIMDGRRVKVVEEIEQVRSTDVVTEPAAGGQVLRLVAAVNEPATPEAVYSLIKEHRSAWAKGFSAPNESEDFQGFVVNVLESALVQAEECLKEINPVADEQDLKEVARGVTSLNKVIKLMREGKTDQALLMLQDWIGIYPVQEKGDEKSRRRGLYSFSYSAPERQGDRIAASKNQEDEIMDAETQTKLDRLAELEKLEEDRKKADAEREKKFQEENEKLQAEKATVAREKRNTRIETRVKAAGLPETACARVIESLTVKEGDISEADIDAAVTQERDYIEGLGSKAPVVKGMGGAHEDTGAGKDRPMVQVQQEQRDKYAKGFDGFFANGLPVDNIPAFTSMHEAWGIITGRYADRETMADNIMHALRLAFPRRSRLGCMEKHQSRLIEGFSSIPMTTAFRETIGTGDFPIAFGDSLFRRLIKEYADPALNDWREIISSVENLTDATNDFNLIEIGATPVMPDVPQKGPYQEVSTEPTEANEKLTPTKKGFLLKLTWEDMLADKTGVIRRIPRILGRSAARTIQQLVWDQIETNPVLDRDSVALINATHNNIISGSPALTFANVVTAIKQLRDQKEQDSLEKLGLNPAFLLVGPTREALAHEITQSTVKVTAGEDSTVANFVRRVGVMSFPTIGLGRTSSTEFRWYVAASPKDAETIAVGFLGGRDRPDLFVQSPVDTPVAGEAFDADLLTFKQRLVVGAKAASFRWIQGSLATT